MVKIDLIANICQIHSNITLFNVPSPLFNWIIVYNNDNGEVGFSEVGNISDALNTKYAFVLSVLGETIGEIEHDENATNELKNIIADIEQMRKNTTNYRKYRF